MTPDEAVDRSLTVPRIEKSTADRTGSMMTMDEFFDWLAERRAAHEVKIRTISFDDLTDWDFSPATGDLRHRSGKFFTVQGLNVKNWPGQVSSWSQPIMNQPEVGILGLIAKEFNGTLHFLVQAKMEPGNINIMQLSPTVQATLSNYTGAHRGADVRYIDYFTKPRRGSVLVDLLQSEHGWWFWRKRNRNMVVELTEQIFPSDDFCWLTLGQLGQLLRIDRLLSMDLRSVLSCMPATCHDEEDGNSADISAWIQSSRSQQLASAELVPLADLPGWCLSSDRISCSNDRFFSVMAIHAAGGAREVPSWSQPMFQQHQLGRIAFLYKRIGGVAHVLACARREPGLAGFVEVGPTVLWVPGNSFDESAGSSPDFLPAVLDPEPAQVLSDTILTEEGGRLYHSESRYLVVEVTGDSAAIGLPPDYKWITVSQLYELIGQRCVTVQARTLAAFLRFLA